jgi:hypothetical protein
MVVAVPRVTGIGGVFIRARDADALRSWYSEHLGITIDGDSGAQFTWTSGGSTVLRGGLVLITGRETRRRPASCMHSR